MSNQIQLFTSRDQECERMNVVFIYTSTQFKLKPDTFVISKSKSSWGGAFSKTTLQWKTENAALKTEDLKFVSEYFLTLGVSQIQQSRSIANYAGNKNCGDYKAPPKQINPFADEDEDDLGGQSFSVSGGFSGQRGGTNYNAKFGYKNEWDEDDLGTSVRRFDPRRKPTVIVWDEDDLGGQSFTVSCGVSGQSGGNNYNAKFGYKNEWDEDDLDDLGGQSFTVS